MSKIQSHKQIWGTDFPAGVEWDAGVTIPGFHPAGRWTVRREAEGFAVVFHTFQPAQDVLLRTFPPDEAGEVAAKTFACLARDNGQISP
jgi:hypothetical protein